MSTGQSGPAPSMDYGRYAILVRAAIYALENPGHFANLRLNEAVRVVTREAVAHIAAPACNCTPIVNGRGEERHAHSCPIERADAESARICHPDSDICAEAWLMNGDLDHARAEKGGGMSTEQEYRYNTGVPKRLADCTNCGCPVYEGSVHACTTALRTCLSEERGRSCRYFDRMTSAEGNLADLRRVLGVPRKGQKETLQAITDLRTSLDGTLAMLRKKVCEHEEQHGPRVDYNGSQTGCWCYICNYADEVGLAKTSGATDYGGTTQK